MAESNVLAVALEKNDPRPAAVSPAEGPASNCRRVAARIWLLVPLGTRRADGTTGSVTVRPSEQVK